VSVTAARRQSVLQEQIEDVVFLTLRYAGGSSLTFHLSWLHPRKERAHARVRHKMLEFDDVFVGEARIYDKGLTALRPFTQFAEYLTIRDATCTSRRSL